MDKIKKLAIAGVASAIILSSFAGVAFAGNGFEYSTQPGYAQASECGAGHGAFGYFGKDNNLAGGTPAYHGGAVGQEPGATGYNNSTLCGNPQN